jgi:undecaprenyl-diphosphatase
VPDFLKAVLLGIIQGLTEFIPVSSTGHLVVFQELLGADEESFGLAFDASIHLGTLVAVLVYFRRTFLGVVVDWSRSLFARKWNLTPGSKLGWLLVLGTIPGGLAGYLLEGSFEQTFRSPSLVAVTLIAFSGVMLLAERLGRGGREIEGVRPLDALIVGTAQAIALIPGVSRSGITISAGMMLGLRREQAAAFAFMLSAPIIAAAGGLQVLRILTGSASAGAGDQVALVAIGMVTAGAVGFGAIAFLMRFLRGNPLHVFIAYRLLLGALIFGLVAAGAL